MDKYMQKSDKHMHSLIGNIRILYILDATNTYAK